MSAEERRLPLDAARAPVARGQRVTFTLDGRTVTAHLGETVAAALYAQGVRVLSRSIKYHRPRGLYCGVGKCASCFVRVDGKPNVRSCITPVRDGMVVGSQNALPNARNDLLAVVDKVYRKDFDYHAKFIRPKFLKPVYHKVIRRMAGFGEIPDGSERAPAVTPPVRRLSVDVAVVGAGAAGLAAADAAARAGATVALFEEQEDFGGEAALDAARRVDVERLLSDLRASPRVTLGARHSAVALYPETGLVVMTPEGLLEVRHKALVLATGSYDVLPLFESNDLPGVLSVRAAMRLLVRHGIAPGRRVLLAGATDRAALVLAELARAGIEVAGVVDDGHRAPVPAGVRRFEGATLRRAKGGTEVEGAILALADGSEETVPCDAIILCHPAVPRPELPQQAGCAIEDDPETGAFLPRTGEDLETTVEGVFVAGGSARPKAGTDALLEGALAGAAAAKRAGVEGGEKAVLAAREALAASRKGVGA